MGELTMLKKIFSHIGILTRNLEESEKFYTGILGFKKVFNFTKNGKIGGFCIKISNHNFIEFFEDKSESAGQQVVSHFCLETNNIREMKKHLEKSSIPASEIKVACDNTLQFWVKDPNGINVEFQQFNAKSSHNTGKDAEMDW
jgi:catechol 2,3-dioxygenase-like lactoylglutathione lyase family enzyme